MSGTWDITMQEHASRFSLLRPPVNQWVEAFNSHNVAAIVALYTEDAELFDSGMKHPRRGHEEIEHWFRQRFSSMPSIRYMPSGQVFMEEGQTVVVWTASGHSPRLLGQAWLSRPFQVDGVSLFTLRNGLIYKQRGYYDHLSVLEQILPPLKWILPGRL
jgi:ketosteroid isomerase-like protein